MLETIGLMATAIMGAVEVIKASLLQLGWFKGLTELQQSLFLQLIAWALGALAGFSYQINALASVPAFAGVPVTVGYVITGLIAGTGSAGIHIIFALIGLRGGVTAEAVSKPDDLPKALSATGALKNTTYSPWN